jgi:hypothetical protein
MRKSQRMAKAISFRKKEKAGSFLGGDDKQPDETPAGKLVAPCRKNISLLLLI